MLEENVQINYSKSVSDTFSLNNYIQFTFPHGTYSIDDFNTKIKEAVLQEKQGWKSPQIKNVKLIIQKSYTYTACNNFVHVVPDKYLEKINVQKSFLFWLVWNIS